MDALQDTRLWLERAVIGLNLCPFAKAVHQKGQIRWVISDAGSPAALLRLLAQELKTLHEADPAQVDTTLIVHPWVLQDFLDFNDFLDAADELLLDLELDGVLQIASFHPHYQFAGADADDPGNCSNRSPYPTLHLLREASIDRAVASFPDASMIFESNIKRLEAMGLQGWQQLMEKSGDP
jgi:hypothetical protein